MQLIPVHPSSQLQVSPCRIGRSLPRASEPQAVTSIVSYVDARQTPIGGCLLDRGLYLSDRRTRFYTVITPETSGAFAFAVVFVALGILTTLVSRKKTVEAIRGRDVIVSDSYCGSRRGIPDPRFQVQTYTTYNLPRQITDESRNSNGRLKIMTTMRRNHGQNGS